MFVALRTTDRSRVTSFAAQWDNRLGALRELATSGQLICPGCEQRLWFRIGSRRRRHFLEGQDSRLRIYRGLRCVHGPNLFAWEALREDLLSAARISPKTGEIVLAEDVAARASWKKKLEDEKRARRAAPPHPQEDRQTASVPAFPAEVQPQPSEPPADIEQPEASSLYLNGPFRCEDCGVETMDWSSATPSAGTCVCKSCTRKRYQRLTGEA